MAKSPPPEIPVVDHPITADVSTVPSEATRLTLETVADAPELPVKAAASGNMAASAFSHTSCCVSVLTKMDSTEAAEMAALADRAILYGADCAQGSERERGREGKTMSVDTERGIANL